MDIDALINEKIQKLQDLNRQMEGISKKIGALQEEGRALHGQALQIKGAIEGLAELKSKEDAKLAESLTAKLTLPVGVKPIVAEDAVVVPAEKPVDAEVLADKAPVTLEVK